MTRPTWTRARLERVMCLRFGFAKTGGPDTLAAAAAMGVSRRTIQRWLHAPHGRSLAHIPPKRLAQLLELLLPSQETRDREAHQARYAEKAISGLHLPKKMGILPAWEKQRWLEQHLVAVLEIKVHHLRIRQLVTSRSETTKLDELKRRGRIVDMAVVPTRFHATALTHRALTELEPWRYEASADQVKAGFTQCWLADGPPTHLDRWARELEESRRRSSGGGVTDSRVGAPSQG